MDDFYLGITREEFSILFRRYRNFLDTCNDLSKEPVKVYSPLSQKSLAELYLKREVSQDLQKKKEEDMKKAAQAAEETEEKMKEKTEEVAEEKKPEETEK